MYIVTAREMQTMDRRTIEEIGIPGQVLMENAARGAVDIFLNTFPGALDKKIGVMAGRGNNGGDGFVMARYLAQWGAKVTVFLLTEAQKLQGDALSNWNLLFPCGVETVCVPDSQAFKAATRRLIHQNIWIDAILGTGLKSEVKGYFKDAIVFLNQSGKPIFAVDLPSGLDADTGQPLGSCIHARATATFAFAKTGHVLYPGADLSGAVSVVDIGIPATVSHDPSPGQRLITAQEVCRLIMERPSDTHKGRTGHLLVVAGSPGKAGAAAMCASAAMRAGAGLVTLGVPQGLLPVLMEKSTEVMTMAFPETPEGALSDAGADAILSFLKEGKRCLALGPGIGTAPQTKRLVHRLIAESPVPLVLDADALNLLAEDTGILTQAPSPVILTPHPGELSRLTGLPTTAIQADRIGTARRFAKKWRVHLILKGAATVTAIPDGTVAVNASGNPGMASGGMGDVLTGLIAGLIVQGYGPAAACKIGVFLHGAAADAASREIGPVGYLAGNVAQFVPSVFKLLLELKNSHLDHRPHSFITLLPRLGEAV